MPTQPAPPPPAETQATAPTPPGEPIDFTLLLRIDQDGIERYLAALEDRGSPSYHRYLTNAEFGRRFGLPAAELRRVRSLLAAAGLRAGAVNAQRSALPVRGSARAVGALLRTSLVDRTDAQGRRYHEATRPPTLPAALRRAVVGVSGLSTRSSVAPAGLDSRSS